MDPIGDTGDGRLSLSAAKQGAIIHGGLTLPAKSLHPAKTGNQIGGNAAFSARDGDDDPACMSSAKQAERSDHLLLTRS